MDTGAAVWMYGQDWPLQGEIDVRNLAIIKLLIAIVDIFFCLPGQIFEGWNDNSRGRATLHTQPG